MVFHQGDYGADNGIEHYRRDRYSGRMEKISKFSDERGRIFGFFPLVWSMPNRACAGIVDDILAASFAVRHSIRILGRSGEAGKAVSNLATRRQRRIIP